MKLFIGLGNPGPKYERNRHNIGFMAADEIHRRHGSFSPWRSRFQALTSEGTLDGEKILLMKPTTFMNESGRAAGEAMRFYKISPEDVVVLYDELDLPAGRFRMKTGGGHGGHNGLRSLTAHISENYRRVRLGISHPGHKDRVHQWVLGDFPKVDHEWLEPLLEAVADNAALLAKGHDNQFANKVTLATRPQTQSKPYKKESSRKAADEKTAVKQKDASAAPTKKQSAPALQPETKKGPLASGLERLFGSKGQD
ncbi:aminoacyl-tRNA hydrolase [Flexibacterium corallicola]|uniref:aminoacyl-tRNA hydrolase n=1 Tax=Flexibacterium corallicola TaxID=3037259 RepID=UPI00286EE659|nr:aminoacyl-tRNA hydrolase [Pseudovibrio sp. M1P-2-3]